MIKITQIITTQYESPSGYTLRFGNKGQAIVKDSDGDDVSVIGASNPKLKEIYELIQFGREHQLGLPKIDTIHKDSNHN
jgi:hypothetical protein